MTAVAQSQFETAFEAGQPQIVWRKLIDDLETPVSAYLKIARDKPYAFLFESVEGGALSGRYSILTLSPDIVWRCFGDRAEIARGAAITKGLYTTESEPTLTSLR
ncbi:MAG: anthranilate synthase component I, partial [Asticcacaulis sp.]|nr:anthranilate synthase component I [Asticcacaulis sp.]